MVEVLLCFFCCMYLKHEVSDLGCKVHKDCTAHLKLPS